MNIYGAFFIFDEGNIVMLFNGFQKKTQKTPESEIEKAVKLKNEYYASKPVGSMDAVLDKLYGKVGTNKSYISRIEKGALEPGVGLFFRIIDALGLKVEIVKPMI